MKNWKEYFEGLWFPSDEDYEDEESLEDLISENKIKEEFEKYGYHAHSIDYDDETITVTPFSNEMDGGFSKNFCEHMKNISNSIFADDFRFSSTFQVIFSFDKEKIINIKKYNV